MILPVIAYGDPILRKKCIDISAEYDHLQELIDHMFETMYAANGVGLAAPQIGKAIRLFIVDSEQLEEDEKNKIGKKIKQVFINAKIVEESGEEWSYVEGCLSIPKIREEISRQPEIRIKYYDREFNLKEETFDGVTARIIQHEYDHIEGILFTDKLKPLKKKLLKSKLNDISKGVVDVDYKMRFPFK